MTPLDQLAEVVSLSAIASFALLGLLIGAFYGFELNRDLPPIFPRTLLIVGWLFIGTFIVWSLFGTDVAFQVVYQVGRGILWTITCAAIPIGRYGRHLLDRRT